MKKKFGSICMLVGIVLTLFLFSCEKDSHSSIPYVYVNFEIYPNTMDYCPVGTSIVKSNYGYKGVIIYRISQEDFLAFDACCPRDIDKNALILDPGKTTTHCETCGRVYRLTDGSPKDGSDKSLLQYNCIWNGNTVHISN